MKTTDCHYLNQLPYDLFTLIGAYFSPYSLFHYSYLILHYYVTLAILQNLEIISSVG